MIQHELQNIKELKTNKAHEASEAAVVSFLNKFLLNMLFNQVKIPGDFNS